MLLSFSIICSLSGCVLLISTWYITWQNTCTIFCVLCPVVKKLCCLSLSEYGSAMLEDGIAVLEDGSELFEDGSTLLKYGSAVLEDGSAVWETRFHVEFLKQWLYWYQLLRRVLNCISDWMRVFTGSSDCIRVWTGIIDCIRVLNGIIDLIRVLTSITD